ncbi:MAG TPA: hypothetical protein VF636_07635 [Sphingomonas sp.]|jgi:hypothetical protein
MFKRKVFYVGGFDPRGVRYYHAMHEAAVARWAEKTGKDAAVTPRERGSSIRHDWSVVNRTDGAETDYSFLRWEDLVSRAWIKNPLELAVRAARAYWGHFRHLDRHYLRTLPRGPIITLLYPFLGATVLPLLIGLLPFLLALIWLPWWGALLVGLGVGFGAAFPLLRRIHAFWLLRFFVFNAEQGGGEGDPALAARLDAFAYEIEAELDGDWDEVLLVTHSNGSILAVPLMARLLRARGGAMPDRFTLVTLGHCIPLVAGRHDAVSFRAQLAEIARGRFQWLDIGSPPDGAAFHAVDPMRMVTDDPRPALQQLSPRFHLFYDPETYHKGYANKYEIHFDYLRVGDRVSPLDFGSLTASALPLDQSVAAFRLIP